MDPDFSDIEVLARSADEPSLFAVLYERHSVTVRRYLARRAGAEAGEDRITLYVDARTYEPLRETEHAQTPFPVDRVTAVLPATATNIARAESHPPTPSGYTRGQ